MSKYFTDQMGRTISVEYPPKRIVSLVPSQTEFLYAIGLDEEIVGQTLFCIHPEQAHLTKPRVGGTKKLNMQTIAALNPDLIIGNKEENEQEQIELLSTQYPVWMSDIRNLEDALSMMRSIGELVDRKDTAIHIASEIQQLFITLISVPSKMRVAYLIWREPWMSAGEDTFINDMLKRCGWENVFINEASRYPSFEVSRLAELQPDIILLSSEPYPFKDKHVKELEEICPQAKIMLVDGELFSWYGSRLLHSVNYFSSLIQQLNDN